MNEDLRCCGSGTCIIDHDGRCWCGQQWDGEQMCQPASGNPVDAPAPEPKGRVPFRGVSPQPGQS